MRNGEILQRTQTSLGRTHTHAHTQPLAGGVRVRLVVRSYSRFGGSIGGSLRLISKYLVFQSAQQQSTDSRLPSLLQLRAVNDSLWVTATFDQISLTSAERRSGTSERTSYDACDQPTSPAQSVMRSPIYIQCLIELTRRLITPR